MKQNLEITYRSSLPQPEEFFHLFETTGWYAGCRLTALDLHKALQNSWTACSAYAGEELVGFGRVVSDGILHAMIYEMIVLPAYQGKGIGAHILAHLVGECQAAGIKDIQLFCAKGKRGFYEKYGFSARPEDAPGMALKYPLDDKPRLD